MTHYVCTGNCQGEASRPGLCQNEDCSKEGQPLEACDCDDGIHKNIEMDKDDFEEPDTNLDE